MKKICFVIAAALFLLAASLSAALAAEPITAEVTEIAKYGNLKLNITGGELLERGYAYGDVLHVTILNQTWETPLCSSYSDVDAGFAVLRAEAEDEPLVAAINMGDLATTAGVAVRESIEEDPGYRWHVQVMEPVHVTIELKQAGGYYEQWLVHQLERSNERGDYPHLSDEAFANFRMIDTTGMASGRLYRSSSPINAQLGRSHYADRAAQDAGIACVVNLADAANVYEDAQDAYYQTCDVIYLNLGVDFAADSFKEGLTEGLRFMIQNDGPYLVHCAEGKDRAGFVSAVLECLMGASADEVTQDYMETYVNYYGIEPGTEKYDAIVAGNIEKMLCIAFEINDLYAADLAAECGEFLRSELGMTQTEIDALMKRLGE